MSARWAALVLFALPIAGQSNPREMVRQAEALVAAGDTDRALALLQGGKSGCPSPDNDDCSTRFDFALGYTWTVRAGSTKSSEDLKLAFDAYTRVLTVYPDNSQAWINIAQVHQMAGRPAEAAEAYVHAEEAQKDASGRYLLAAAEIEHDAGNLVRTADLLRRAGERGAPDAWPRLVAVETERLEKSDATARPAQLTRLLDLANELTARSAEGTACDALEVVIANADHDHADIAETALERWTRLKARSGTLSVAALGRLPSEEEWASPMLHQLVELVTKRQWSFGEVWLSNGEPRRAVAIAAAIAVGDDAVSRGELETAAALYRKAMHYDGPQSESQSQHLSIALRLARVYTALKDEEGFAGVMDDLFNEKTASYQNGSIREQQEVHILIGTIYKERDDWIYQGDGRTGATFQLENAILVTHERERAEGILQPLPHLYDWLVTGYLVNLRADDARDTAVGATRGYLELDDLEDAARTLQCAKEIQSYDVPALDSIDTLGRIMTARGNPAAFEQAETLPEWTSNPLLDDGFIARQQFKLLADAAATTHDASAAQRLYRLAFQAVAQQQFLSGTADELRLDRARKALSPNGSSDQHVWTVASSGESEKTVSWP